MRAVHPDPHLILVVPCFNEEQRLPVDELRNFTLRGARVQFCFVNDGSRDGTLALLQSLASESPDRFFVIDLARNRGKAEAVREGILAAIERGPDVVGFWDADLATPLPEIGRMLNVLAGHNEVEMVFAARVRLLGKSIARHPMRHYLGRMSATLISLALDVAVYDTQCGAKLFRANPRIAAVFARPFAAGWLFDVEIIARLIHTSGHSAAVDAIYEMPLNAWVDVRGSNVSAMSYWHSLRDLWKIVRTYGLLKPSDRRAHRLR